MSKLVILITSHTEKGLETAEAWQAAGAPGVTLIESHGLHRLQEKSRSLELPVFISMASVLRQIEETSQVILSVAEDKMVDKLIEEANRILGDLTEPGAGIIFVLDVERVVGVRRHGVKD